MGSETIAAIEFDDSIVGYLAESVYEIHRETVRTAGLDMTSMVSDERRSYMLGVIASILSSVFTPVFGQPPSERYEDVFDQISIFAEHLAKRHVFADGNKRTTMQISIALLGLCGARIVVPDPMSQKDNAIYRWIQDVVTGERTTNALAEFLRRHAESRK